MKISVHNLKTTLRSYWFFHFNLRLQFIMTTAQNQNLLLISRRLTDYITCRLIIFQSIIVLGLRPGKRLIAITIGGSDAVMNTLA